MDQKIIDFNKKQRHNKFPKVNVGDIVRVHRKIKEGQKERIQVFKGLVIAIKGKQSSSPTITVRRVSAGVGIEMIFPIFSPVIEKIELLRHSKVRRSKLYYMRERFGKSAKMKAIELTDEEKDFYNKKTKQTTDGKKETEAKADKKEKSKENKESKKVKKSSNKDNKDSQKENSEKDSAKDNKKADKEEQTTKDNKAKTEDNKSEKTEGK